MMMRPRFAFIADYGPGHSGGRQAGPGAMLGTPAGGTAALRFYDEPIDNWADEREGPINAWHPDELGAVLAPE